MILISVDFPAPFSPTSAWTSPRSSVKFTPSSAICPEKTFVMPSMRRRGSFSIAGGARRAGRAIRQSEAFAARRSRLDASVRLGDVLRRVRRVEEPVGDDDLGLDIFAAQVPLQRVEGD